MNADNRNSRINLVIDNTIIIDRYKNVKILLFKEALKINERKPTLNKRLKSSNELQFFHGASKQHVLISCNEFKWRMLMDADLIEAGFVVSWNIRLIWRYLCYSEYRLCYISLSYDMVQDL